MRANIAHMLTSGEKSFNVEIMSYQEAMPASVPITKPTIKEEEIALVMDAVTNGWGKDCYKYIEEFERMFCNYVGASYAVATSSGTGAMQIGLRALGIEQGDEVIVTNTTWVATIAPILQLGAVPVYVDINESDWCINVDQIEKAITCRTKAVICVHLYGNLCQMSQIERICNAKGIFLIEDAAEALGSTFNGKHAGTFGVFGIYSFHGSKLITTGEGGMLVTNDEKFYQTALTLSNHGRSPGASKQFWPSMIGYKFKMSNLQAALGVGQLKRINEILDEKRRIFETYLLYLNPVRRYISMNQISSDEFVNCYWLPTVVMARSKMSLRDQIITDLKAAGVDARLFFWPLSSLRLGGRKALDTLYVSEEINLRSFNLPSYEGLTEPEIRGIADIITDVLLDSES